MYSMLNGKQKKTFADLSLLTILNLSSIIQAELDINASSGTDTLVAKAIREHASEILDVRMAVSNPQDFGWSRRQHDNTVKRAAALGGYEVRRKETDSRQSHALDTVMDRDSLKLYLVRRKYHLRKQTDFLSPSPPRKIYHRRIGKVLRLLNSCLLS